jgi:excisionase family DNA binding protein
MTRDAHPVEQQYSPGEAANLLMLSRRTIYRMIAEREIEPVRLIRGKTRIPASAINRYLQKCTV